MEKNSQSYLRAFWLGRVPYLEAVSIQRDILEAVKGGAEDVILFLEHPHVYTIGRRGNQDEVLADDRRLSLLEAEVIETDRGGRTTYHGPGQLVAYPIINLRKAKLGPVAWARLLEETVLATLMKYGIFGHRVVGRTGVFVEGEPGERPPSGENPKGRKIAAIGVRVSGGVTMHGFALNVAPDISMFDYIVPCGMPQMAVTSIYEEAALMPSLSETALKAARTLANILGKECVWDKLQYPFATTTIISDSLKRSVPTLHN